jgi:hypothetical protein
MSKQMLAQLLVKPTDQHERDLILNGCYIAIRITGGPVSVNLDIVVRVNVHRAAEWASGRLEGRRGKRVGSIGWRGQPQAERVPSSVTSLTTDYTSHAP